MHKNTKKDERKTQSRAKFPATTPSYSMMVKTGRLDDSFLENV